MTSSGTYCDFHLHSCHSDGEFSPARLVDIVADAGVHMMALTDHDTTAGHGEARKRADARGVAFVGGIEMTAYAAGQVVHVLVLGVPEYDGGLAIANEIALNVWSENQLRWIESLEGEGLAVSSAHDFPDRPVRLPVLIERLCARGVDGGDARKCHARFREFFGALPPDAYARLPSPTAAAAAIRNAGGVAILAHPARLRGDGLTERFLDDVDGIEALYAPYDAAEREQLLALARAHSKLYSCGSDYHGYFNGAYVNPRFSAPATLLSKLGLGS
jgi:predicted metal-dependent phosphoesterase TrpH